MSTSFNKLLLDSPLLEGLKKEGITTPTDIQMRAIPKALKGNDLVAESETGSGKTLAYLLPILKNLDINKKEMQSIILAPTHELAMQINNEIKSLSKNSNVNITSTTIIGSVNIKRQIENLKSKPHVIVGSAGRILELIKKKKIKAHTVKTIVMDEGDKLLDKNNASQVKEVIKTTMRDTQLMLFSASISDRTLSIAKDLMKDPVVIKVKEKTLVNPNINHMYFVAEQREKIEVLRKLVASINPERAIVFINKSEEIELTTLKLQYHHIKAYGIYGAASKEERKKALDDFRRGKLQLLIASDIAARGLDIKDVTHVFNLDLPKESKEYLHRVGRTGRCNNLGTAISIVTEKEASKIRKYQREFDIKIDAKKIYGGKIID